MPQVRSNIHLNNHDIVRRPKTVRRDTLNKAWVWAKRIVVTICILLVIGYLYNRLFIRTRIDDKDAEEMYRLINNLRAGIEDVQLELYNDDIHIEENDRDKLLRNIGFICDGLSTTSDEIEVFVDEMNGRLHRGE